MNCIILILNINDTEYFFIFDMFLKYTKKKLVVITMESHIPMEMYVALHVVGFVGVVRKTKRWRWKKVCINNVVSGLAGRQNVAHRVFLKPKYVEFQDN